MTTTRPMHTTPDRARTEEARLYVRHRDGNVWVTHYGTDNTMAYAVWLGLGKGVLAAMRTAGDTTPVYSHDYVDRL